MKSGTKLVAVIAAAAASITACGGSGSSDEDAASKVVVDLNNKIADCFRTGDCEAADFDDYVTGTAKDEVAGIATGMQGATMDTKLETKVTKVTLDGDTGTVDTCAIFEILSATQDGEDVDPAMLGEGASWAKTTNDVEKIDGKWKVSGSTDTDQGEVTEGEDPCAA